MTLIEKLITHIHEAMQVLRLQETAHLKKIRQLVREKMQPHRAPDNPYRQVKTTGQC